MYLRFLYSRDGESSSSGSSKGGKSSSNSVSGATSRTVTVITTSDASIIGKGSAAGKNATATSASASALASGGYYYNAALAQFLSPFTSQNSTRVHLTDELLNALWWTQFRPLPFPSEFSCHVSHRMAHMKELVGRHRSIQRVGGASANAKLEEGLGAGDKEGRDEPERDTLPPVSWGFKSFELSAQNVALHAIGLPPCLHKLIYPSSEGSGSLIAAPSASGSALPVWGQVSFGERLGIGERHSEMWRGWNGGGHAMAAPVIYKRGANGSRPDSTSPKVKSQIPEVGAKATPRVAGAIDTGGGGATALAAGSVGTIGGVEQQPVVQPLTSQFLNQYLPTLPRTNSRDNLSAVGSYMSSLGSFGSLPQSSSHMHASGQGLGFGQLGASWEVGSLGGSQSGYLHQYGSGSERVSSDDNAGRSPMNSYDAFDEMIACVGDGLGSGLGLGSGSTGLADGVTGGNNGGAAAGAVMQRQVSSEGLFQMISSVGSGNSTGSSSQLLRLMDLHDSAPGGGVYPHQYSGAHGQGGGQVSPPPPPPPPKEHPNPTTDDLYETAEDEDEEDGVGPGWDDEERHGHGHGPSGVRDEGGRLPRSGGILKRVKRPLHHHQQQHHTSSLVYSNAPSQPLRARTQSGSTSGSYEPSSGPAAAGSLGRERTRSHDASAIGPGFGTTAPGSPITSSITSNRRIVSGAPSTPVLARKRAGVAAGTAGAGVCADVGAGAAVSAPPEPPAPATKVPLSSHNPSGSGSGGGASFFPTYITSMMPTFGLFGPAPTTAKSSPTHVAPVAPTGAVSASAGRSAVMTTPKSIGTGKSAGNGPPNPNPNPRTRCAPDDCHGRGGMAMSVGTGTGTGVVGGGVLRPVGGICSPGRVKQGGVGTTGSRAGNIQPQRGGNRGRDKHVSMNFGPALGPALQLHQPHRDYIGPGQGVHYSSKTPAKPTKMPLHSAESLGQANATAAALPNMSASLGDNAFGFQLASSLSSSLPKRSGLMGPPALPTGGGVGGGLAQGQGLAQAQAQGQTGGIQSLLPGPTEEPEDEKAVRFEFYKTYRKKYSYNPFKREEGRSHAATRTQNRRRWVHVFPLESKSKLAVGLNWKSLCQPALLPLTTDFLPSPTDLRTKYDVARNYSKILVADDICGFDTPANLLMEMICQRLAMDYQLVEGVAIAEYEEFFNSSANMQNAGNSGPGKHAKSITSAKATPLPIPVPLPPSANSNAVAASTSINTLANKLTAASVTKALSSNPHVSSVSAVASLSEFKYYILSMGHRIQFMVYDPNQRNISVTLCIAKDTNNLADGAGIGIGIGIGSQRSRKSTYNRFAYPYQLWVPNFQHWKLITQVCHKFAKEEYNWSQSDEILLGGWVGWFSMI